MIFSIEALKLYYTTIERREVEGAKAALATYHEMLQLEEVECVRMCFAVLYRRWWPNDPRSKVEPFCYRYNEVPAISEWRLVREWTSPAFARQHSFCKNYNGVREVTLWPNWFPLCEIRISYGFHRW
jgi:hypothetical protein